jgi:hypothetical protein
MGVDVDQLQVFSSRWRALLKALRLDLDLIADRIVGQLLTLPSYRAIPAAELRPGVARVLQILLNDLDGDGVDLELASTQRRAVFAQLGELRARQGASIADLVRGWRVATDEVIRRAREVLLTGPDTDRVLIQLYQQALVTMDGGMALSAQAHQATDADRDRLEQHARATLVRALLLERRPVETLAAQLHRFGLDRDTEYYVVRARPSFGVDTGRIERYLAGTASRPRPAAVLALLDGDVYGLVDRLPTDPAPVAVGVAGPSGIGDLGPAFQRASRVLEAALALGRNGLVDVAGLGVDAAVVADTDVGDAMLDRYVRPLEALGAAGALILDTVSRFLGNDGRLDTTARELHVHVNTVRYRLGRFEQVTGSSLRSNDTLVEVWWALRRRTLT